MLVLQKLQRNKMTNKKLIEFIKEARKRGFGDATIKKALVNYGWPLLEVEKVFISLIEKYKFKNQVTLFLDTEILELIEKRAKKNLFTINEQIEDILRRSTLNQKNKKSSAYDAKMDDTLISIFSRKRTGPKRKK